MMQTKTLCDNRTSRERIDYLDAAKGIFILLIVIGHHLNGAESVVRYLYSMGVTPFFMISGFLYAYRREWEAPLGKTFVKKAQKLLYPFVTFSVINLLWNVLYYRAISPREMPPYSMKTMLAYTLSTYGYNALWYLPCVMWGTLVFFALRRVKNHAAIWGFGAVGLMVFYILFDKKLTGLGPVSYAYCYLLRIAVAVVFLYAGSLIFELFQNMSKDREKRLLLICSVISLVIAVLYQLYPQSFPIANLAAHRLGNPYVYYVTAVSNTLVILLVCRKFLRRSKVLSYFGRNSLIVMALHMDLTGRIAWWFYPKLHMNFGERIDSLIIIAMELVMFPIINTLINKCFPFILRPKKS